MKRLLILVALIAAPANAEPLRGESQFNQLFETWKATEAPKPHPVNAAKANACNSLGNLASTILKAKQDGLSQRQAFEAAAKSDLAQLMIFDAYGHEITDFQGFIAKWRGVCDGAL